MYSTWNIPKEYKGACAGGDQNDDTNTIVYNSYYQWVPLYFIFLGVLFYLPRMFWLMMEGGIMKFFGKGTTTRFSKSELINKYFDSCSDLLKMLMKRRRSWSDFSARIFTTSEL